MANRETFLANAFETTLTAALAVGATTASVTSTTGSPAVPFLAVVDPGVDVSREVVLVTAKTATSFTITRGQDGTTDVAHDNGAVMGVYVVAQHFTDLNDRVDAQVAEVDHTKVAHDALALDHGSLTGLADDDHAQYHNSARHDAHDHSVAAASIASADLADHNKLTHDALAIDHGSLTGLADDDHTQYLNDSRHNNAHGSGRWERGTTNQTVATGTVTDVIYNSGSHESDADNDFTYNATTGVITVNNAGVYRLEAGALWTSNSTGYRRLLVERNGTETVAEATGNAVSGAQHSQALSTTLTLTATDTLKARAFQNSGGDLGIVVGRRSFLSIAKVSE